MSCSRCEGTGKINMYYGHDKNGLPTTVKRDDNKKSIVDRDVLCWLCFGTGEDI